MGKETRVDTFGISLADIVIEAAHLTYNASRGKRIVEVCIKRLQERIHEIQPKKADPKYKKARYGKDKKSVKGRKDQKKKKYPDFSPNIGTLNINARQTAGWPMVDVINDAKLFRKRSSFK